MSVSPVPKLRCSEVFACSRSYFPWSNCASERWSWLSIVSSPVSISIHLRLDWWHACVRSRSDVPPLHLPKVHWPTIRVLLWQWYKYANTNINHTTNARSFSAGIMRNIATTCLAALAVLPRFTRAACECGYSANITGGVEIFTDLIETDFTKVKDIRNNTDWVRQEFNKTNKSARGPLGEKFMPTNIASVHEGSSSAKRDAGLQLLVESSTKDGLVPVAEIDSSRHDLSYGSFRAVMKIPNVAGTCAAFFWVSQSASCSTPW